jgi:hypothetical protein
MGHPSLYIVGAGVVSRLKTLARDIEKGSFTS